ncbi:MAG TPA: HEAT repeat domain-containing protein [Kofleriaceae bacterium]|jgi:HEAT repeat protein
MIRCRAVAVALGLAASVAALRPARANFDWAGHEELDAANLRSDDVGKRREAVQSLAKYDISLKQAHLLRAIDDPDAQVREEAARQLGSGRAAVAVPLMIDWLAAPEPKTRQIAASVLGDIGGPQALGALVRSLGDAEPAVRNAAVVGLGNIGTQDPERVPAVVVALIPRLEDDKPDVRHTTVLQLEALGDRRAVIPLVARFGDMSTNVKQEAVRAVGRLGDAAAVPALVRVMTTDGNEDIRSQAVAALGALGAAEALDALGEQLQTGSDQYRKKVAFALAQIAASPSAGTAGEDAVRRLVENLASPTTRQAAIEALLVAGKAAVPGLVASLEGRIPGDPKSAVSLLEKAGDPRATAALTAELERGRVPLPDVLAALGATKDPGALVPILGALGSKDPVIRLAAMNALRPLVGTDARAGDVLAEHLADENVEVRVLAAEYLGLLHAVPATQKLVALAGPGAPLRLRRAAIDALGEIGRPDATPVLLEVLRDGAAELRRSAASALAYIADPAAIEPLAKLVRTDHSASRSQLVFALGRTLAVKPDPGAHALLRELAADPNLRVGVAAIAALAAGKDPADAALLRDLVLHGAADRQRAAAWALGELHDAGSVEMLASILGQRDDRLVGDAAWAIGEILSSAPTSGDDLGAKLLRVVHVGGWAAAIDASAAVARLAAALPDAQRPAWWKAHEADVIARLYHRSRLVRANLARALGAATDDASVAALAKLLRDDPSPGVRIAAVHALYRSSAPGAKGVLAEATRARPDGAAHVERDPAVLAALKAAPPALPPRTEWRSFYVVDPGDDDAPVREEPFFVPTSDDLVWATYTDARGELTSEHVPAGNVTALAASREQSW